jgi:hypothetical protein
VTTWALVIAFSTGGGVGMTTVPGFTTEAQCKQQATLVVAAYSDQLLRHVDAFCVAVR